MQSSRLEREAYLAVLAERERRRYRGDPVGYAENILAVNWWHKQQEIAEALLTPPYRVLVKACHSVGKCMSHTDMLVLADGRVVAARDVIGRYFAVLSFGSDGEQRPALAFAEDNGIREVFRVTTESGRQVQRTSGHPLYVADENIHRHRPQPAVRGWVPVRELSVGDLVLVPETLRIDGKRPRHDDEVALAGYLLGDGGLTRQVKFTQMPGAVRDDFIALIGRLGCRAIPTNEYDLLVAGQGDGGQFEAGHNPVLTLVRDWGMLGALSKDKRFPAWAWELPNSQLAVMLNRIFACDGWAYVRHDKDNGHGQIGISLASEGMIRDIEIALLRFGICGRVRRRTMRNGAKQFPAWEWATTHAATIQRFAEHVGMFGKEAQLGRTVDWSKTVSQQHVNRWRNRNAPDGYRWERVKVIESIGEQPTVAVCVPEVNTYVTTFVEHNTFLGGGLVNWWFDSFDPGIVLTTAPTARQVEDLLWKEVRVQRGGRGGFPGPKKPRLESAPDHFAHGYTATDGDSFQGHHSEHLLIVFDEAVGIDPVFWETAESMFGGEGHGWLAIFNPTDTSSQAYAEELTGNWHTISLSALEHPNIAAELAGLPPPLPAAIRLEHLERWLRAWFRPVNGKPKVTDIEWPPGSGEYLRPGPLGESRVLGRWPSQATNSVWSDGAWQMAEQTVLPEPTDVPCEIGCDVARFGDDYTSIHVHRGPVSLHHETANGWGTDETAGRLKQLANQFGQHCGIEGRQVVAKIDDDGVGGGVTDQAAGYNFVGLSGQNKALDEDGYPNRRSEVWFALAERAEEGRLDVSRLDAQTRRELRRQAMAPTWKVDNQGRRVVEPKDKTKERIKRSPDDMDAMNLSYAPATALTRVYTLRTPKTEAISGWQAQRMSR